MREAPCVELGSGRGPTGGGPEACRWRASQRTSEEREGTGSRAHLSTLCLALWPPFHHQSSRLPCCMGGGSCPQVHGDTCTLFCPHGGTQAPAPWGSPARVLESLSTEMLASPTSEPFPLSRLMLLPPATPTQGHLSFSLPFLPLLGDTPVLPGHTAGVFPACVCSPCCEPGLSRDGDG